MTVTSKMAIILRYFTDFVMALILHYFTEFVYGVDVKQLLGLPRFQNLLLIVYDHLRTFSAINWAKQTLITRFAGRRFIGDWVHCTGYH